MPLSFHFYRLIIKLALHYKNVQYIFNNNISNDNDNDNSDNDNDNDNNDNDINNSINNNNIRKDLTRSKIPTPLVTTAAELIDDDYCEKKNTTDNQTQYTAFIKSSLNTTKSEQSRYKTTSPF